MANVPSEGISLRLAPATKNVVPTAEWQQAQIDKGSLQNWKRTLITVERDIHTPYMVKRQGDVVGWTVAPSFAHDINKDLLDLIAAPAMRCVGQHPGGTDQRKYRVSAVVDGGVGDDEFTVAANGALAAGLLIKPRGLLNEQNNQMFVTTAGATTAIKVATDSLVAEASAPANAYLDVVGFQGAAGDLELDANGDMISTTLDFTTLDLQPGMRLVIGGEAAGNRFATEASNCIAYVASAVTAHKIPLTGHIHDIETTWTAAADDGDTKTIQVFFSSLYRNYSILDTKYAEPLLYGELEEPRAGSDGTARYTDCKWLAINTLTIAAQLRSKITATLAMVGLDAGVPVAAASRTGGAGSAAGDSPAQAYAPLVADLADGHNDLKLIRLYDDSGVLVGQMNQFTLSIGNNVSAMECLGTPGAVDHIFGEFMHSVNVQAYYNDSEQTAAASDNRKLTFDAFLNNGQYALSFRMPQTAVRNDQKTYAANTFVTQTFDAPAFGDDETNVALEMHVFGYVPPLAGPQ